MDDLKTTLSKSILCPECEYSKDSTIPYAYNCKNKISPCRNRIVYADFGCTYGKKKSNRAVII